MEQFDKEWAMNVLEKYSVYMSRFYPAPELKTDKVLSCKYCAMKPFSCPGCNNDLG